MPNQSALAIMEMQSADFIAEPWAPIKRYINLICKKNTSYHAHPMYGEDH